MKLKALPKPQSAAEARNQAVEWQHWMGKQNLSYWEMAEWEEYFSNLAENFGLEDEFKENGII